MVSIFLMLIGVTVFGYSILMVALIINEGDPRASTQKRKMAQIEIFLNRIQAPRTLRNSIRRHFETLTHIRDETFESEDTDDDLLYFLDPYTKAKLRCESFLPFQRRVAEMLKRNLDITAQDVVADFVSQLRITQVEQDQVLFEEKSVASQLYILLNGTVEIWTRDGTLSDKLNDVKIFGITSIMTGSLRLFGVTARTDAKLAFIPKHFLLSLCERYPKLRQRLYSLAARRIRHLEGSHAPSKEEEKTHHDHDHHHHRGRHRELNHTLMLWKNYRLIHPDSRMKLGWDLLVAIWVRTFLLNCGEISLSFLPLIGRDTSRPRYFTLFCSYRIVWVST